MGKRTVREFGMNMHTLLHLKWKCPTEQHGQLCSVLYGSLDARGGTGRMGACILTAESLACPPEISTMLLTGYIK